MSQFDYDWVVVGSGFGGSVSALRLAEKGYGSPSLECGKRFARQGLPEVDLGPAPLLLGAAARACAGSSASSTFKDVSVVSGCGVGGGSLGYANTLYVPPAEFFKDPQWADLADWERSWRPTTPRRSGCSASSTSRATTPPTSCCASTASTSASATPTRRPPSGSTSDEPGKTVADPFFGGEGPDRTGCTPLRALHGRLPARRQEHAGQELPLAGRTARRRGRSPTAP